MGSVCVCVKLWRRLEYEIQLTHIAPDAIQSRKKIAPASWTALAALPVLVSTCGANRTFGRSISTFSITPAIGYGAYCMCGQLGSTGSTGWALRTVWLVHIDLPGPPMSNISVQRKLNNPFRMTMTCSSVANWHATASIPKVPKLCVDMRWIDFADSKSEWEAGNRFDRKAQRSIDWSIPPHHNQYPPHILVIFNNNSPRDGDGSHCHLRIMILLKPWVPLPRRQSCIHLDNSSRMGCGGSLKIVING